MTLDLRILFPKLLVLENTPWISLPPPIVTEGADRGTPAIKSEVIFHRLVKIYGSDGNRAPRPEPEVLFVGRCVSLHHLERDYGQSLPKRKADFSRRSRPFSGATGKRNPPQSGTHKDAKELARRLRPSIVVWRPYPDPPRTSQKARTNVEATPPGERYTRM